MKFNVTTFKMGTMDKLLFLFLWILLLIHKNSGAMFYEQLYSGPIYLIFFLTLVIRVNTRGNFIELIKYRSANRNDVLGQSVKTTIKSTLPFILLFLLAVVSFSMFNEDLQYLHYTLYHLIVNYTFIVLLTTILNIFINRRLVLPIVLAFTLSQFICTSMRVIGFRYFPGTYPLTPADNGGTNIVNMWLKTGLIAGFLFVLYKILEVKADEK